MTKVKSVVTELITQLRQLPEETQLMVLRATAISDPLCYIDTQDIVDYLEKERDAVTLDNATLEQLEKHPLWPCDLEEQLAYHFEEVKYLLHVDKTRAQTLALEIVGEIIGERFD